MKDSQRKAIFAQKTNGLNKVTVRKVGDKYQNLMNGRPVFKPTDESKAREQLRQLKVDAIHHDKTGTKLNE